MPAQHDCGGCGNECDGSLLDNDDDALCIRCALLPGPGDPQNVGIQERLTRVGKAAIVAAVTRHKWSLAKAAEAMAIGHGSLYWWMTKHAAGELQQAREAGALSLSARSKLNHSPRYHSPKYQVTSSKEEIVRAVKNAGGNISVAAKAHGIKDNRTILDAFKRLAPVEYAEWQAWRLR